MGYSLAGLAGEGDGTSVSGLTVLHLASVSLYGARSDAFGRGVKRTGREAFFR